MGQCLQYALEDALLHEGMFTEPRLLCPSIMYTAPLSQALSSLLLARFSYTSYREQDTALTLRPQRSSA